MNRSIACALALLFLSLSSFAQTPQVSGSTGEIYVNVPPAPYANGVLVLAKPGSADIAAKLGGATALADFTIFDSADLALFTVTGDRKLGIGTQSPAEAFHLIKDAAALTRLRLDNANTAGGHGLYFSDGTAARAELTSYGSTHALTASRNTLQLWNYAGGAMIFGLNDPASTATNKNIERMRITPNGMIGVGLNNPTNRFQVFNTTNAIGAVFAQSVTTAEGAQADYAAAAYATQNVPAGIINPGSVTGLKVRGYLTGPGHVDDTYGITIETGIHDAATGTAKRARGLNITIPASPGVLDAGYGIYVASVAAKEAMGLYIADIAGTASSFGVYQNSANDKNFFAGQVGIGVKPTRALDVVGDANITGSVTGGSVAFTTANFTGAVTGTTANFTGIVTGAKLGIGMTPTRALDVDGDANFTGTVTGFNIKAKFQDVAEWVPSTTDLAPGTVVVLNKDRDNEVMMSTAAYDTTVAGVVSAQPGLSLGEEGEGKEQVATTGRVLVRVDARTAPIRVGDLLVTSEVPGTAMRSEPMAINGRKFHQPGTIIGKALQPLDSGIGEILVLLSMQ